MKKNIRGVLSAILLVSLFLLCLCVLPAAADGTEIITGAPCGKGLSWQLDSSTGELVISGEGEMTNYSVSPPAPWYEYRGIITSVRLEEGVTSIGNYAFFSCDKIASVSLPGSLTSVKAFAFWNCSSLTSLTLPEGVTAVEGGAFQDCTALTDVTLPAGLTRLGNSAFGGAPLRKVLYSGTREEWAEVNVGSNNDGLTQALLIHPGHVFDRTSAEEIYLASPATCTDAALYYKSCICGEAGRETFSHGAPNGHTEGAPADCDTAQRCTVCDTVLVAPLGHAYEEHTVEPTCTAQGYTAHTCSLCEHTYYDGFTPAKGHTPGDAATCTSPQFCTVCGGLLEDALGHEYTHTVTEPTCTAVGYTTHACTRCDHVYRDSYTDVREHTPGAEATCTKPQLCEVCGKLLNDAVGHTEGDAPTCVTDQTCTVCGQILAQRLGHNYLSTVTLQPTCTEQGIMTHSCSRCKDSYTRSIAPSGHVPGPEASCTEAQICTVCNTLLADRLGHSYTARTVNPTCDRRGYTLHECSRCGSAYMDTMVPAKGHTPGEEATCTEAQTCTVCFTVLADKLGHEYEDAVTAATCLEQGYTTHTCTRCNHTYLSDFREALGHKAGAQATCTAAQTCTRCAALLADKLGHSYTETVVPPTCTEPGYTLHTCDACKNTYTDTLVAATEHTAGDWIIDRHPGFGEAGRHHLECTVCGILMETETFLSEEDTADAEPVTDESGVTQPPSASDSETEEEEEGGCGQVMGNALVIVLVLVAAFLFWYIDSRRRSR